MNSFVKIGARGSLLSRTQVAEVLCALQCFHPDVAFDPIWIETRGDRDLATSLKHMEKTDFFTHEIDQQLLRGAFSVAIHSAKDLPDPLPPQLQIVALTEGIDPSDVLVWRVGETFSQSARVGTSSLRRELQVKALYPDAECMDIRGTAESRIDQLNQKRYDAIVMAKAALIRLEQLQYPCQVLPGAAAPLQGRLAVVARRGDEAMASLFECIHDKKIAIPRY